MTGPEHYLEAERLVAVAEGCYWEGPTANVEYAMVALAAAQAHATLALAAATAMTASGVPPDGNSGMEWRRAIVKITNTPTGATP